MEAFAGPRLRLGLPVVCTVYSMAVAPFLPHSMPLLVSTDNIRIRAETAGHAEVTFVEPPVDVHANSPDYDPGSFRADNGLDPDVPLLATICRLAPELKLEGLLAACEAVGQIAASGTPLQFVIAGDGSARGEVEKAAEAANARANRKIVVLTGQLADPRPAYAAADLVIGMGSSAERALAFGKPLIVQGEHGFWELLTPDTAPTFQRQGWYGIGADTSDRSAGTMRIEKILLGLLDDRTAWPRLGEYGRATAVERFSLEHVAAVHEEIYLAARQAPPASKALLARDSARSGCGPGQVQDPPEIPEAARDSAGRRLQRRQRDSRAGAAQRACPGRGCAVSHIPLVDLAAQHAAVADGGAEGWQEVLGRDCLHWRSADPWRSSANTPSSAASGTASAWRTGPTRSR